jgi:hypothetical protein
MYEPFLRKCVNHFFTLQANMDTSLKRKHWTKYKALIEKVLTVERCAQMVNQGNVSVRGYDKMLNVM